MGLIMQRFKSLSFRIKLAAIFWLIMMISSIGFTLSFSQHLEGGVETVNDIGSLRQNTYRLILAINEKRSPAEIDQYMRIFDDVLRYTQPKIVSSSLFNSSDTETQQAFLHIAKQWKETGKPFFLHVQLTGQSVDDTQLSKFIEEINRFITLIKTQNADHLFFLRFCQLALILIVLLSAITAVMTLYTWVIFPLNNLQNGVQAIKYGELGLQVPIDYAAEFAQVDIGFNQMSQHLKQLYDTLEDKVAEKTKDLEFKNHKLETLYFFTRFLNKIQTTSEASAVFLERILKQVSADAGSIRLIDFRRRKMDLVAHIGLPESLQTAEACQNFDECLCGESVINNQFISIQFVDEQGSEAHQTPFHQQFKVSRRYQCSQQGFRHVYVFKINYKEQELGVMTLYFRQENEAIISSMALLEALCNQFGVAISNINLMNESRQLAVLQERNLIAQGLHDSIAQALTFLNLQVQMLESALHDKNEERIDENLQFIKEGVKECYEDVRELLLNFRTKLGNNDFNESIASVIDKFERQTQIHTQVNYQGNGMPLSIEQQLQFIFILQESLSNIRKHAEANSVNIEFNNREAFSMQISDNGKGFDTDKLNQSNSNSVGLRIMRERASRVHADLTIQSKPGQTSVKLVLPPSERKTL